MVKVANQVGLVSGGASGLGLATVQRLLTQGAHAVVLDLPGRDATMPPEVREAVTFVGGDVTSEHSVEGAVAAATDLGGLRFTVHTAGRGGPARIVSRDYRPGELAKFEEVVRLNLVGSYNVLRLSAAAMAQQDPVDGERGVVVLTASAAAFEGQVGQTAYAASKAGIVGMTLPAARDLATHGVRVCAVAPGVFDTPLLAGVGDETRTALEATVPFPSRLGQRDEFARLAVEIIANGYLNGETIRLDGALRMAPR